MALEFKMWMRNPLKKAYLVLVGLNLMGALGLRHENAE